MPAPRALGAPESVGAKARMSFAVRFKRHQQDVCSPRAKEPGQDLFRARAGERKSRNFLLNQKLCIYLTCL